MNRVIEGILRCYVNFEQTNWLSILKDAVMCINNSTRPDTGYSPNHVYYGRQPFRPVDLTFRVDQGHADLNSFLQYTQGVRHLAVEAVRASIVKFSKKHAHNRLLNIDPRIRVGSKVMVNAANIKLTGHARRKSNKLQAKRVGPYLVVERVSHTGFRLEMPGMRCHKVFHADMLTPFTTTFDFKARSVAPEPEVRAQDDVDGYDKWLVDGLASRMAIRGVTHYFVIYKGCSPDDGEWVARKHLIQTGYCPDLVHAYDTKHGPHGGEDSKGLKPKAGRRAKPAVPAAR